MAVEVAGVVVVGTDGAAVAVTVEVVGIVVAGTDDTAAAVTVEVVDVVVAGTDDAAVAVTVEDVVVTTEDDAAGGLGVVVAPGRAPVGASVYTPPHLFFFL